MVDHYQSKLLKYYEQGLHCDVILHTVIDNGRILAHLPILAAKSDFLKHFDYRKFEENGMLRFDIQNVNKDIMSSLVKFCYTGKIAIYRDNARKILRSAIKFQLRQIQHLCYNYFIDSITLNNCLDIWLLAKKCRFESLELYAVGFFGAHFKLLINSQQFAELSQLQLTHLLEYDNIRVLTEAEVFNAIKIWVMHDVLARKWQIPNLANLIKSPELDIEFLRGDVHDFCKANQVMHFFKEFCVAKVCGDPSNHRSKPINHSNLKFMVLLEALTHRTNFLKQLQSGKFADENIIGSKQLSRLSQTDITQSYESVFFIKEYVIFDIGRRFEIYSLRNSTKKMSPAFYKQSYSGAIFAESIYLIGGVNDSTVLRYDLSNEFTLVAPLSFSRKSACCAVLSGLIYVMGGLNNGRFLNSAECYNPFSNKWTTIASMRPGVLPVDATACNGCIYVLHSPSRDGVRIDKYDVKGKTWTQMNFVYQMGYIFGFLRYRSGFIFARSTNENFIESIEYCDDSGKRQILQKMPQDKKIIKADLQWYLAFNQSD